MQVAFTFPGSRSVVNRGLGRVVSEDTKGSVIEFDVRDEDAFLRWILSLGRKAHIIEPSALRVTLEGLRADVAALYAEAV